MNLDVLLFNLWAVVLIWLKTAATLGLAEAVQGGGWNFKCIDNEREALVDFKAHLQDPDGMLSTWIPEEDEDCCKWVGVTCNNHTGHIVRLVLYKSHLAGEISLSLLNLTYLNYLDLSSNNFNGTIPMSIGSLTQLSYLDLKLNSFTGIIPGSIGCLTKLRHLDLYYNKLLNGTIPTQLGNLTNLEYLSLGYLKSCKAETLDWLSHLSHLEYLDMTYISLAKANHWVNAILNLDKLSYLSLYGCNLSQVMHPYSSSSLNYSSSIVFLDLTDNNLNSSMYHWLFPLTSNKTWSLSLAGNKLDGIPTYLGNLCGLNFLTLSFNSLVKLPDFLNNLSGCTSTALRHLDASFNEFTGSLADEIQMFSSLQSLDLDHNRLNGTISEQVWELPKLQSLDVSYNSLRGAISGNIGKSKLQSLYLSNNSLQGVPPEAHMSNLSYVMEIDLSSCQQLGPRFPNWIQTLKNLTSLNIANTGISGTIPMEFWNTWPNQLRFLSLSSNNISGMVPDLFSNFDPQCISIDLSSNNFHGPIPNVPSGLSKLDLSKNNFSGGISFLCHITDGWINYLDLSYNSLTGQIPNCLWNFNNLTVLNLGYNSFFGSLPPSLESLIQLEMLDISNNVFTGELPLSLRKCTNLNFLDLGNNRFSGNVPFWIGDNLSRLYALRLASNNLFGTIPLQLCQLVNLRILDLSMNNINGTIPSCVTNLTAMVQDRLTSDLNEHYYQLHGANYEVLARYVDHAMMMWQGSARELTSTLRLVKIIDLSSNNLTGQIPYALTDLHELLVLDLSNNSLCGEIPQQIDEMRKLLTLDLARNNLSGGIPSSISQMASLSYLDVSYNNLSGEIPLSTQLQTFKPSQYAGNVGLCGPPLTKVCPKDVPPFNVEIEDDGESIDKLERWFYIGGASGFAIGFWITCTALLLNRRGRHAFFRFLDSMEDWVHVKVVVLIAKLQRVAHA